MSTSEREIVVAQVPKGHPDAASTFTVRPIDSAPPSTASPGHVLLRMKATSVDPYLRGVLSRAQVGDVMESWSVAEVLDSALDGFDKGDLVTAVMPWRTLQQHNGKGGGTRNQQLTKLQPAKGVPLTAYLGVLGMPGRTAYFGLLDHEVGRFQPGQTVLVSGAAGAVGSLVGQLARLKGAAKVIGTAGGPDKCRLVKEKYGFDECLDYKQLDTADKMTAALRRAVPDGIQLYFDNTGGVVLQAALECLTHFGRIALCGGISGYNQQPHENLIPNPLSAPPSPPTRTARMGNAMQWCSSDLLSLCCPLWLRCSGLKFIFGALNIRSFIVGDYFDRSASAIIPALTPVSPHRPSHGMALRLHTNVPLPPAASDRYGEFYAEVPQLLQAGKIKFDETLYQGFDKVPEAFAGLFHGHNTGKAVVLLD